MLMLAKHLNVSAEKVSLGKDVKVSEKSKEHAPLPFSPRRLLPNSVN